MPGFKYNFSDKTVEYGTFYLLFNKQFLFEAHHVPDYADFSFLCPPVIPFFDCAEIPKVAIPLIEISIEVMEADESVAQLNVLIPSLSVLIEIGEEAEFFGTLQFSTPALVLEFGVYVESLSEAKFSIGIKQNFSFEAYVPVICSFEVPLPHLLVSFDIYKPVLANIDIRAKAIAPIFYVDKGFFNYLDIEMPLLVPTLSAVNGHIFSNITVAMPGVFAQFFLTGHGEEEGEAIIRFNYVDYMLRLLKSMNATIDKEDIICFKKRSF